MKILDSTMRDGLYGPDKQRFLDKFTQFISFLDKYVNAIEIGSPVSLGYNPDTNSCEAIDRDLDLIALAKANLEFQAKIVTFVQPHLLSQSCLDKVCNAPIDYLRIGIDLSKPLRDETLSFLRFLNIKKLKYSINLMKFHCLPLEHIFRRLEMILVLAEPVSVYIVDSSGCLPSDYLFDAAERIQTSFLVPIGFHIHDNHREANGISKRALDRSYFADGTLQGLGRTGGNCDTNQLILHQLLSSCAEPSLIQGFFEEINDLFSSWPISLNVQDYIRSLIVYVTRVHSATVASYSVEPGSFPCLMEIMELYANSV